MEGYEKGGLRTVKVVNRKMKRKKMFEMEKHNREIESMLISMLSVIDAVGG